MNVGNVHEVYLGDLLRGSKLMNWRFSWKKPEPEPEGTLEHKGQRGLWIGCDQCDKEFFKPNNDKSKNHHCEGCGAHFGYSDNPDGIWPCSRCGYPCKVNEPYCPDIYGNHWTPEEWDEMN